MSYPLEEQGGISFTLKKNNQPTTRPYVILFNNGNALVPDPRGDVGETGTGDIGDVMDSDKGRDCPPSFPL